MSWQFSNDKAIYLQIMDKIVEGIINGEYPLESKLPSVRELAADIKVNPNTVQKAYSELESLNIIAAQSTSGRFVTKDMSLLQSQKDLLINGHVEDFIEKMRSLKIEDKQILNYIKEALKDV